jgi:hypothetical protein
MISDRLEREGFANLVRDLIEARELTADLVTRAVEVTKRFWPTEGIDDLFDRDDDPDSFEDLLSRCGSSCSCSPRGTKRDHAERAPDVQLGPSIFVEPVPQDQDCSSWGASGSSSFSSSRRPYQPLLIIHVYGRWV